MDLFPMKEAFPEHRLTVNLRLVPYIWITSEIEQCAVKKTYAVAVCAIDYRLKAMDSTFPTKV